MKLYINNQLVDLPDNISIKYVRSSSVFSPLQGAFSFPFLLRATANNQQIFNYPTVPSIASSVRAEYTAELFVGSFLLLKGTAKIQNATEKTINISLEALPAGISKKIWQTNLNELDLGSEKIGTVSKISSYYYTLDWSSFNLLNTVVYFSADYYLYMEVYADNTLLATSEGLTIVRIGYNPTDADLKKRLIEAHKAIDVKEGYCQINEKRIFVKVDSPNYENIKVKFICLAAPVTNPSGKFKNFTKMSYKTINQTYYDSKINNDVYGLPEISNSSFYSNFADWCEVINQKIDNKIQLNSDAFQNRHTVIPQLKLPWVMSKLFTLLGYVANGDFLTNESIKKLLLFNLYSTDKQAEETDIPFNVHSETIQYANHLPAITIAEFFQALIQQFGIGIEFNSLTKKVELFFVKTIFTDKKTMDLSDRISFAHSSDYQDLKKKQLKWSVGGDALVTDEDPFFQPYPLDIEIDKDKFDSTEFQFPSLVVKIIDNVRQIPAIEQVGISPLMGMSKNETVKRMLFFDGKKADNQTANMALSLYGNNNIRESLHKDRIAFENSYLPLKAKALLRIEELATFDFRTEIIAYNVPFFVEEISAPLTKDIIFVEVEMKLRRYII